MQNRDTTLALIAAATPLRTAAALATTTAELITTGHIPPETQLPTVRDTAATIGMSRSAVGQAWQRLKQRGLVDSSRRGGTHVVPVPAPPHAKRFESMVRASAGMRINLGNIWCNDLPAIPLGAAFNYAARHPDINNPYAEPIVPGLRDAVSRTWPFEAENFLAMHGTVDTLHTALSSLVRPGDHVLVESPTIARIFDIVESLGGTVDRVSYEKDGPDLSQVQRALIAKPVAFVYQPTRNLPTGRSVSSQWLDDAAATLRGNVPIIELDQMWPLAPTTSLGTHLPEQVMHVRSLSFTFGADMRLAIAGGNPALVRTLWNRLTYSSRYVSRITQLAQTHLLNDDQVNAIVDRRRVEIHRRHCLFAEALGRRGHLVEAHTAPQIWLPVPDEHSVCAQLSTRSIGVHPGRFFYGAPKPDQRICINAAAVSEGFEDLAREISDSQSPRGMLVD